MKYFFPSPFKNENIHLNDEGFKHSSYLFDSGKSALRIALRNLNLPSHSKVGIPAFCCDAVEDSVKKENLIPCFFDLKDVNSYWANYSKEKINHENIKAIIITHLYGFKHPDTDSILEFCAKNKVFVIHDIAQSFGIDVSDFDKDIMIYSFGPGKSTTAALGGEIVNPDFKDVSFPQASLKQKIDAILFYYSRLYSYKYKIIITISNKILNAFLWQSNHIKGMSNFQRKKALEAKFLTLNKSDERKARYYFLSDSLANHNKIKLTYNDSCGLYFKLVLYIPDEVDKFISYLKYHKIPFYRLGPDINLKVRSTENLPNFYKSYNSFVEISTERSIEMNEIIRVGGVLKDYK